MCCSVYTENVKSIGYWKQSECRLRKLSIFDCAVDGHYCLTMQCTKGNGGELIVGMDAHRELDTALPLSLAINLSQYWWSITTLQWKNPLRPKKAFFPTDHHYKRDICKTFVWTHPSLSIWSLNPSRFHICKTFPEPRKAILL